MSRTERRTRAQVAALATPSVEPLTSFGIARVSPQSTRWYAFKCVDGVVTPLTPLVGGQLRGEHQPNATGRLKMALLKFVGGVLDV